LKTKNWKMSLKKMMMNCLSWTMSLKKKKMMMNCLSLMSLMTKSLSLMTKSLSLMTKSLNLKMNYWSSYRGEPPGMVHRK